MLMAVIGDIHGNWPALNAVLRAVDDLGIQTVLNTGDAVVGYPWPNEVLEILQARNIPSVQGEMDRQAATFLRKTASLEKKLDPEEFAALKWTYENTRSENIEFLRGLPKRRVVTREGVDTFLCHGTPSSQTDELYEDDEEEAFQRQREAANTQLIVLGRTHEPYVRTILDTLFVNPGSVGIPSEDKTRASYAIVNTEEEAWTAEIHRIEYELQLP